jgi:hypothetical protein
MEKSDSTRLEVCKGEQRDLPSEDYCKRPINALLVRDQPTLQALERLGGAIAVAKRQLDPKSDDRLPIKAVDLLDPDDLLLALLRHSAGEPVDQGPVIVTAARAVAVADEVAPLSESALNKIVVRPGAAPTSADPSAAALFSNEVVIRYETALSSSRHGLVVPMLSGDIASGLSTQLPENSTGVDLLTRRGQIRDAFLPFRNGVPAGSKPVVVAVPSWLFSRLWSVSLNASAEAASFCGILDNSDRRTSTLTFATAPFDVQAGTEAFQHFALNDSRSGFTGNTQLRTLYGTSCASANGSASPNPNALPASMTSGYNEDVCAIPRTGLAEVASGVGPAALALPKVLDPLDGGRNPYILVDRPGGVFIQARPISLGDWDAFLGTFEGCRASFGAEKTYSSRLVTCEPSGQGQAHLTPNAKVDSSKEESQVERDRAFVYYYQVIANTIDEKVGGGPRSLSCLRLSKPNPDDPFCALRMYFASRAVDMVTMMSAAKESDWKADGIIKSFALPNNKDAHANDVTDDGLGFLRRELGTDTSAAEQDKPVPDAFKTCRDSKGKFHPKAVQLCEALERYVSAALSGDWHEAPAAMIPAEDAHAYAAWYAERQGNSSCRQQIGLPNSWQLSAGLVDEEIWRSALEKKGIARPGGAESDRYIASLKASVFSPLLVGTAAGEEEIAGVAGLPVGLRQLIEDPADTATAEPSESKDTPKSEIRAAAGLSAVGLLDKAREEQTQGFSDPSDAWQKVWGDNLLDDPKRVRGAREADPVTGFRLRLLVGGDFPGEQKGAAQ